MGKNEMKKFLDKLPKEKREKLLHTRVGDKEKLTKAKQIHGIKSALIGNKSNAKGPDLGKTFHRITPNGDKCDIKGKC